MLLVGLGPSSGRENAKRLEARELALWRRRRAEKKNFVPLGLAKVCQNGYNFNEYHPYCSECCSKVYIASRGPALKAQYNLMGDYYEMTDCEKLKNREGCDSDGGYWIGMECLVAELCHNFFVVTII